MTIAVDQVFKHFGGAHPAIDEATITIGDGELVALLGPSGGGKTTLLRVIAGLEAPDRGTVTIGGTDVTRAGVHERGVGFVFQHFALFREMSVLENVAFGLRVRPKATRPSEAEIQKRVKHLLEMVQLEGLAGRYPEQLSGGQRQRVALARALAVEPKVLLLDEPFGALDARVRRELRKFLRSLHDELGTTSVLVTHDQEEAFEIADRVAVIHRGKIQQLGTPEQLLGAPANDFVREFLSELDAVEGLATGDGQVLLASVKAPDGAEAGSRVRVVRRGARIVAARVEGDGA
ncbi:MAG: sulfate ABC transporter ATP-binding protein [Sandaracinus sp.]